MVQTHGILIPSQPTYNAKHCHFYKQCIQNQHYYCVNGYSLLPSQLNHFNLLHSMLWSLCVAAAEFYSTGFRKYIQIILMVSKSSGLQSAVCSDCGIQNFDTTQFCSVGTGVVRDHAASIFRVEGSDPSMTLMWLGWGCKSGLHPLCHGSDWPRSLQQSLYNQITSSALITPV